MWEDVLNHYLHSNQIFFDEVYPCVPFIHHVKHDPNRPQETAVHPPLCLRYVMWAHAAVRSSKFQDRSVSFYRTARMHLEHDEMQVSQYRDGLFDQPTHVR